MGFISEFKAFAMKGNVVDMAVGVVIGAAFGKIVSALVEKIFMPIVGVATSGVDFSKAGVQLKSADAAAGKAAVSLGYGAVIQALIDFIIVAFCLFLVIKAMNAAKKKEPAAPPPPPPPSEQYLKEIRDLLAKR